MVGVIIGVDPHKLSATIEGDSGPGGPHVSALALATAP